MIVDAQVHVWSRIPPPDAPKGVHPVPTRPFLPDELLQDMDAAGVDRVVLVPTGWDSGNDAALAGASANPDRFAVVGLLPIDRPESRDKLEQWPHMEGMRGLRAVLAGARREWLFNGTAEWLWPAAARLGIPIMIFSPGSEEEIGNIASRFPDLQLSLCHLNTLAIDKDEGAIEDFARMLPLARHPNITVKASALPAASTEPYPFRNLHAAVRRIIDAFGPERVFWGTDKTRLECSYRDAVTFLEEEFAWSSRDEKEWVMGRGVCKWLNWAYPEAV